MRSVALGLLLYTSVAAADDADLAKAADRYKAAEQAMTDGRYADAARDYGAAYDISKDPVLFFKIGSANEKAGKCDVAVIYFRRYLDDAHPGEQFAKLTQERIDACTPPPTPTPTPTLTEPSPSPSPSPPPSSATPAAKHDTAWLLVGGTLALLTTGGVLAYSAGSTNDDIKDLYAPINGVVPQFDMKTQARYQDLVDEGNRYEHLAWLSFGLAGATAIGAAILFLHDGGGERVTPVVGPHGAGVAVSF
jgi:hypothetical protein